MQAALQQNSVTAQLDHFLDFVVNRFERQNVAVLRANRPVERAEGTIFGAEIRVINVAVDLIRRHARVGFAAAHFVRGHADADQVVGVKKIERFLFGDSHGCLASDLCACRNIDSYCIALALAGPQTAKACCAESAPAPRLFRSTSPSPRDIPAPARSGCSHSSIAQARAVAYRVLSRPPRKCRANATRRTA